MFSGTADFCTQHFRLQQTIQRATPNYLAFSGLPYGSFWLAKRPIRQRKTAVVVWPYGPNLTQERTGPTTNIIPDITQCRHAGAGSPRQYATDYIN